MVDRRLVPLPVGRTDDPAAAMAALRAALDGRRPVVPVPDGPAGEAVLRMAQIDTALEPGQDGAAAALVVPTSGSTGEPKGALLSSAALRASATATLDRLGGPGQWLLALPLTHIAGLQVLIRSLVAEIDPVWVGPDFHPLAFAAASERLAGSRRYTALVPTQLRRLLDGPPVGLAALAAYDAVLVGGASLDPVLRARAQDAGARVVTTYGMSETCGGCVYDGVPLAGVQVRAPADGPVRLGGPVVFSGYRLRPDLTASSLEVAGGTRWHVTSDLGRLDPTGRLDILGRVDDMVITGGENVAPAVVEAALAGHPAVAEVVALGVPDPAWGQRVVVVVVRAQGADPPSLRELRAYAAATLPPHALPRQLLPAERIPLLPSGKPDRGALRVTAVRAAGS